MEFHLQLVRPSRQEALTYAARVLLDAAGLEASDVSLVCSEHDTGGLRLAGELLVSEDDLEQVFSTVSLHRESEAGCFDQHGRFDEAAAVWDTATPWIERRASELAQHLGVVDGANKRAPSSFQVIITHDLDRTTVCEPTCLLNALLADIGLRRGKWVSLAQALSPGLVVRTIERLLVFEKENGVNAYFFFMSGPFGLGRYATRTDIRWKSARKIAALVLKAGMRAGLHGSYAAHEQDSYRIEKDRIEQAIGEPINSHRNHYLRFDCRKLWSQLERAGIAYDFSLGFISRMGFRTGMARLHRTFDSVRGSESTVLSVPTLFMDEMLLGQDFETAQRQLRSALECVRDVNGCVALLFHPDTFAIEPRVWTFFQETVSLCKSMNANLGGQLPTKNGSILPV